MRFLFKKQNSDSRTFIINIEIEGDDLIKISFQGKGHLEIGTEDAPDGFLINSFYDVIDHHYYVQPAHRYVVPKTIDKLFYTQTVDGYEYKLKHIIDTTKNVSEYVSDIPDFKNKPKTIEGKSVLYRTVLHFMQSNKNYISFESKEEREKFNNFFDDNFISVSEVEENEKLKNIINTNLGEYQTKGNKFLFFTKPPERAEVIQELTKNIRSICDKKFLYASDYEEIVKQIIAAREKVIVSHKANSVLGSWGVTSSRLAESLNKCLTDMMSSRLLSKNTIEKLEKQNEQNRILKI